MKEQIETLKEAERVDADSSHCGISLKLSNFETVHWHTARRWAIAALLAPLVVFDGNCSCCHLMVNEECDVLAFNQEASLLQDMRRQKMNVA